MKKPIIFFKLSVITVALIATAHCTTSQAGQGQNINRFSFSPNVVISGRANQGKGPDRLSSDQFGLMRVSFIVHWFTKKIFSDNLASGFETCISVPERELVYCYERVEL